MQIDEKGLELSTLSDILDAYEIQLQSKYGADFYIKPEGIIDNIANSAGFMEMSLQEQIAFLTKQFDPETAENTWQDALYERINVYRLDARPTVFTKKILGEIDYSGEIGSITIRNNNTGDEFTNISEYTIDSTGSVKIDFQCVITGTINVSETDTFSIVQAPDEITGLAEDKPEQISIGRERETDNEYRIRFRNSKAMNAKATRNANEANLVKYVDNQAFLKIIDKKTDKSFEAGTLLIIAKHNTTDKIFAQAVFETVADGIDLLGDTQVIIKDSSNQDVIINFKNADEISMDITAVLKIKDGYYPNTVFSNVKQNILKYIEKRVFGLESIIYATEFIIPMLEVDGVDAVISVQIKKDSDSEFFDNINLKREEVPIFASERITISEAG